MKTNLEEIITAGSRFYQVPKDVLLGRVRERRIAMVRFSIMFMCRKAGHTYADIGRAFKRDHGTVIHACQNTGPNQFGPLWRQHCHFMELAKALTAEPDPVESVRIEVENSIAELASQIEQLNAKRDLLLSFRARIQPTPELKAA